MRVLAASVQRFRGIRSAQLRFGRGLVCLVGPGGSTKTTILNALDWALGPRWQLTISDLDFYEGDISSPIEIEVIVGGLAEDLLEDKRFGLDLRGYSADGELHEEPEEGDELALQVRLRVDDSLEPSWKLLSSRHPDGRRLEAGERRLLCVGRCSDEGTRDFTWSQGSLVGRIMERSRLPRSTLAGVARAARGAFDAADVPELEGVVAEVTEAAKVYGVGLGELSVGFDPRRLIGEHGSLSVHDAGIPLALKGKGTRRLLALAVQMRTATAGGIALVDDVEIGLEPFRIRHLIRRLRNEGIGAEAAGQVVVTSYSPTVIAQLESGELYVVRCRDGVTTIQAVPDDIATTVRKKPEAILGRRVLVCEGDTELGIIEAFDSTEPDADRTLSLNGTCAVVGGGDATSALADRLAKLGYEVAVFRDSDKALARRQQLLQAGVTLVEWADGQCTEGRLVADLPWAAVQSLVRLAAERNERATFDGLNTALRSAGEPALSSLDEWDQLEDSGPRRGAVVAAATQGKGWFKSVDAGRALGGVVRDCYDDLDGKDLRAKLDGVFQWVCGG